MVWYNLWERFSNLFCRKCVNRTLLDEIVNAIDYRKRNGLSCRCIHMNYIYYDKLRLEMGYFQTPNYNHEYLFGIPIKVSDKENRIRIS